MNKVRKSVAINRRLSQSLIDQNPQSLQNFEKEMSLLEKREERARSILSTNNTTLTLQKSSRNSVLKKFKSTNEALVSETDKNLNYAQINWNIVNPVQQVPKVKRQFDPANRLQSKIDELAEIYVDDLEGFEHSPVEKSNEKRHPVDGQIE